MSPPDTASHPHAYCTAKLAGARSAAQLALVFTPSAARRPLTAVHALELELREIAERSSDPGVGRARSAWWGQELAAAAAGHPTHPVTRELGLGFDGETLARVGLDEALEQVLAIAGCEAAGEDARRQYARALGGACVRLSAAVARATPAHDWTGALGGARLGVDAALATGAVPGPDAAGALRDAMREVPAAARAAVADQIVLAAIGARSTGPRGRPGPAARLFIAWRAARAAHRASAAPDFTEHP